MSDRFTYYLNINFAGWEQIFPLDSTLDYVHKIDEKWIAIHRPGLEGEFKLTGDWYDDLKTAFENNHVVWLKVFRDGDSSTGTDLGTFQITEFSNWNVEAKEITLKDFVTILDLYYLFLGVLELNSENFLVGTDYPLYTNLSYSSKKISDYSHKLDDIINTYFVLFDFDPEDAWYDSEAIDLGKIRLADLTKINGFGSGQSKKITYTRLFEIIQLLFNCYVYLEETEDLPKIKFKTPNDLVVTILDLSADLKFKRIEVFNNGMRYGYQGFKMNKNNTADPSNNYGWDENSNKLTYQNQGSKEVFADIPEICTRYTESLEYNVDGFFMAYVDNATNKMEYESDYSDTTNRDNARLCQANLLHLYYQNFIYTKRNNYALCGNAQAIPSVFREFIELPEVTAIIEDIEVFREGLRYKGNATNQLLGRVYEQRTNLKTNITAFKCYEFIDTLE